MPSDPFRELLGLLDHYSPSYLAGALYRACVEGQEPAEVCAVLAKTYMDLQRLEAIECK